MPYVSRNKQFHPKFIDGLFVWIDNSKLLNLGFNSNLQNYTFNDTSEFNNDVIGTDNIRLSNANIIFNDYDYAQTSQPLSMPTIPNSFTIFYVGKAGFSKIQNNLITLFNADSNSIKNSNTIAIVVDSYNIAYATNLQLNINLNKFSGGNFFINNLNSRNIFTGTFDKTNSQLWVNGLTNGSVSCSNIFPIENIYKYILTIQSNNGFYFNSTVQLNSFNETLIYNRILNNDERIIIEEYLTKKWNITYPGSFPTGINVIPGLIIWYNIIPSFININNNNNINQLFDSSEFLNTLTNEDSKQLYSSNYKLIIPFGDINFYDGYYSNYIFTPRILSKGITISFVTTNSFYSSPGIITSNIMTLFSPRYDNLSNLIYPTIKTDGLYNIFAGGNVYSSVNAGNSLFIAQNKFTLCNRNPIDFTPTTSNIKELCVITIQFIDYNSYGTTQLFINGYPMMINSNGPSNWIGSNNYYMYYSGIPNSNNSSRYSLNPLDLGETLIYDRILDQSELSVVHQDLFVNYSIFNLISSNGLIGWFDAADHSSSVGRVLNRWTSKGGVALTLSNPNSNSFALIRNYSNIVGKSNLTFIDLNNGSPSYFVNRFAQTSTYSNLIVFYVVLGNSNVTSNGYIVSFGHSNRSITYFAQSNFTNVFGNTSNGIYATTNFSTKPDNQPIITGVYASNSDNNLMRFDTVSQNTMTIGSIRYNGLNISNINIGAYLGSNFCKTQIGEVLIYNRPLDKYEYINIFGYLQSKWCSPTVVPFPTDYVLRYDACNISLDLTNWYSSENKGPNLSFYKYRAQASVSFAYFNRPFLSNNISTQFSNTLSNISLQKGFTIFTVTSNVISNVNTFGNIVSLLNSYEDNYDSTLGPNILLSNNGTSNIFLIGNKFDPLNLNIIYNDNQINETYSYTPLNSTSPLINCFKYNVDTSSYSITTKGAILEVNNCNRYTYTNYIHSNYNFSIGGLGSFNFEQGFNSLIGEVLVYNRALNDYETELVSAHLTEKWNTPLVYPITIQPQTISCNISFSTRALRSNTLTLSNIPVASNYYNFPMTYHINSIPSLGNPSIINNQVILSNVYGSCNYIVTLSSSNPFGSASLVLYSDTTPPGIPFFPANYNSVGTNYSIRSNLQVQTSNNTMILYSNILLTSILCNDAYGYDRNDPLSQFRIWCTLSSNTGEDAIINTVTCNISRNGLYNSNINITFSNLVEEIEYKLTLFTSNISGITSNIFSNVSPQLGCPFFSNTFSVGQPISYISSNYTNFTFNTLQGAAKARTAADYYVTMRSNTTLIRNFTTIINVSPVSESIYSNVSLSLSNLIGMVSYNNITLVASNRTGIMLPSSHFGTRASNSLGSFITPPGPPAFFSQNLSITSNGTSILYSNIIGPYLLCNSILYPESGWGTWNPTNRKSGIFGYFELFSNSVRISPELTELLNGANYVFSGHPSIGITLRGTTSALNGPNIASNISIEIRGLQRNTLYKTIIFASNISGIASNEFTSIRTPT